MSKLHKSNADIRARKAQGPSQRLALTSMEFDELLFSSAGKKPIDVRWDPIARKLVLLYEGVTPQ
jgi:hypothetical protein